MTALGIQMQLLIGPSVAIPAPPPLLHAMQEVSVTRTDKGQSGFQITFKAGRSSAAGAMDFDLLTLPILEVFNRVIVTVVVNALPLVLIDGIVAHRQASPSPDLSGSTVTLTGDDVSMMMDLEEKIVEHPAQPDNVIATKVIASYAQYGLIPEVIPPLSLDPPNPIERTPVQNTTDLKYLRGLAARHGYVFYVVPGPFPGMNQAYWGPPKRLAVPQRALTYNLGSATNVDRIAIEHDGLAFETVSGNIQDRQTNQKTPVQTIAPAQPPLSARPAATQIHARKRLLRDTAGANMIQAMGRAQGRTDASADKVVKVSGQVDVVRYGQPLEPQGVVGLRGVGFTYDGLYYVQSVTHRIRTGQYKQDFTLVRDGTGANVPAVVP